MAFRTTPSMRYLPHLTPGQVWHQWSADAADLCHTRYTKRTQDCGKRIMFNKQAASPDSYTSRLPGAGRRAVPAVLRPLGEVTHSGSLARWPSRCVGCLSRPSPLAHIAPSAGRQPRMDIPGHNQPKQAPKIFHRKSVCFAPAYAPWRRDSCGHAGEACHPANRKAL